MVYQLPAQQQASCSSMFVHDSAHGAWVHQQSTGGEILRTHETTAVTVRRRPSPKVAHLPARPLCRSSTALIHEMHGRPPAETLSRLIALPATRWRLPSQAGSRGESESSGHGQRHVATVQLTAAVWSWEEVGAGSLWPPSANLGHYPLLTCLHTRGLLHNSAALCEL